MPSCFRILLLFALLMLTPSATMAAKKILYLGDSLSMGAFGQTLDARLRQAGFEVYTSVTGGATPYYWLKEFENVSSDIGHWNKTPVYEKRVKEIAVVPKVEDLLAQIQPDAVVVQTGVNLYSTLRSKRQTPAQAQANVEGLIAKMAQTVTAGGRKLYWITPPSSHPERFPFALQTQMNELTQRVIGKYGRVFDSYAVTKFTDPFPATDGIHYGPTEAAAWAEIVAKDAVPWLEKGKSSFWSKTPTPAPTPTPEPGKPEVRRAKILTDDPPISPPAPKVQSKPGPVTVELRLVKKSDFETPSEITYNSALAIYEWEVLRVLHGSYSAKTILVAHVIVRNRKITAERDLKLGKTYLVELVPLSTYPNVEQWETIDKLSAEAGLGAEIYIPKM